MSRSDWELQFATNVHGPCSLSEAIPTSVRAKVVAHLLDPANGIRYTGQVVSAPSLHTERGL